VELIFAKPAPALSRYISAYYTVDIDYPTIVDIERAGSGHLRFNLSGRCTFDYPGSEKDPASAIILIGPGTRAARHSIVGPYYAFGCVLMPEFWDGIIAASAAEFANHAKDAAALLGEKTPMIFDALRAADGLSAMTSMMDAFLTPLIKPIPKRRLEIIERIAAWLAVQPTPSPEQLYETTPLSSRQVMRIANHHFGAPPKMLARKMRALRTASRILGSNGAITTVPEDNYTDRAHMSREIKTFTGLTPRQLQINSSPIMQTTLRVRP
jgi:AraC-like DNA-binding protein